MKLFKVITLIRGFASGEKVSDDLTNVVALW